MTQFRRLWWRLIRFGFRLLYNEFAFTYDLVSKVVSLGQWRCWQRSALAYLSPSDAGIILELAHGTGDLQLDLAAAGYQAVAHDLSPYMGRIARKKLHRNRATVRLSRGYAQQLPFAANSVAAVVCTFPTPFIVESKSLRELHRVMQAGSKLIIVPSGVLSGRGVAESALEWLYKATGQREGDTDSFVDHIEAVGFHVETRLVDCPRSTVLNIIATKAI